MPYQAYRGYGVPRSSGAAIPRLAHQPRALSPDAKRLGKASALGFQPRPDSARRAGRRARGRVPGGVRRRFRRRGGCDRRGGARARLNVRYAVAVRPRTARVEAGSCVLVGPAKAGSCVITKLEDAAPSPRHHDDVPSVTPAARANTMLDNLGKNAASKKFVRAYDRYTVALCGAALVAYGAQQYFVRLLVVPADRHAPGPPDRVLILVAASPRPVPPPAVPRTHRPRSFPRASQGWDDAPLRHPQGGSRPQSREGRRREDGRRAMTKTATAKQATIEDGRRRPRRRFEPTVRRWVRYDRLGDVYIYRRDAASNPRASSSSSSSSPHA